MKKIIAIIVAIVAIGAVAGYFIIRKNPQTPSDGTATSGMSVAAAPDAANASYIIDGEPVTLSNGAASNPAGPGSASMVTTRLFGTPTIGDLNNDGRSDAAVLLVRDSGGSGMFYYAAAVIAGAPAADAGLRPLPAQGTNAIFLGDRIAPQSVEIKNGVMIVNYADRAPGQPMSAAPSVGKTAYFVTDGTSLYEAPIAAAYPLYAGSGSAVSRISWDTTMPVFATTTPSLIGVELVSQPITNLTDLATPSTPFMDYYRRTLAAAGWTVDNMLAAGGPGAEITGYTKGSDYFIVSYASDFKVKSANAPEQCPCDLTFSLFAGEKMN